MSVSKEDLVDAISKLNDLTRRKAIVWASTGEREGSAPNQLSYSAPYEGRTLRITECDNRRARILYTHPSSPHAPALYKLEIVDVEGNSLYEFPNVQGVSELFASVRAQQSDVDVEGLIRSLIAAQ
jgi:hypothetical protein